MRSKEFLIEMYIAFEIDDQTRNQLFNRFPPRFPKVLAHHITYNSRAKKDSELPEQPKTMEVVGYATDGESIEALVVAIDGDVKRADGKTYHITWSLDPEQGRKPVHSNDLIDSNGYEQVKPINIAATAKLF